MHIDPAPIGDLRNTTYAIELVCHVQRADGAKLVWPEPLDAVQLSAQISVSAGASQGHWLLALLELVDKELLPRVTRLCPVDRSSNSIAEC